MKYGIYDIETDGLLMECTVIHCMVIMDSETLEVFRFGPDEILKGIAKLKTFERSVGHNSRMYDDMVLRKLYPKESVGIPPSLDTLLISRVWFPDMYTNPVGGHGLKSWGWFLKFPKGNQESWDEYTPEMLEYCVNDVLLTKKVLDYLLPKAMKIPRCIKLEHQVADIIAQQIVNGVYPDVEGIRTLLAKTSSETRRLTEELQDIFPPIVTEMKTPQFWWCTVKTDEGKHREPTKGALQKWIKANSWDECGPPEKGPMRTKTIPYNPGSDDMLAARLIDKYGWKPTVFGASEKPSVSEEVLKHLKYHEAQLTREYRIVKDRQDKALDWEARIRIDTGRIHGGVTTNGTITGRMSHSKPNLGQVPRVGNPWGEECRACFIAEPGKVLVGCDASGLELRMFAHYISRWDGGAYVKLLLESDIHTYNQKLAGLPTRDTAKTFIYGLFYGAGDAKLGKITNGSRQAGLRLRNKFMDGLPAFKSLSEWIKYHRKKYGCLVGLDGRILPIRSAHMALNTLLQSAGAVVMKQALVFLDEEIKRQGWDAKFILNVHDEWQLECAPSCAEEVGRAACESIRLAGEHFKLRCPLAGEYKVGATWRDTH